MRGCSRREAEWLIEGGWVQVDGRMTEAPGARVRPDQDVVVAQNAKAEEAPPVTLLLHKPAGWEAGIGHGPAGDPRQARSGGAPDAGTLLEPGRRYVGDSPPVRVLQRHFRQQECFTPLADAASGLVVYTQDRRMARRLAEDIELLEQECIATVDGRIAEGGLERLCRGLEFNGRPLPPAKVSWQSETRLRFALKGIRPGQIPAMCGGRRPAGDGAQAAAHRPRLARQGARRAVALPAAPGSASDSPAAAINCRALRGEAHPWINASSPTWHAWRHRSRRTASSRIRWSSPAAAGSISASGSSTCCWAS